MAKLETVDGRSSIGNLSAVSKLLRALDAGTVVTVTVFETAGAGAGWTTRRDTPGQLHITDVDGVAGMVEELKP